jgi:hypothetical protein
VVIVPTVVGKTIYVYQYITNASTTVTTSYSFSSATTPVYGPYGFSTTGTDSKSFSAIPWVTGTSGGNLAITQTGTNALNGTVWFKQQ